MAKIPDTIDPTLEAVNLAIEAAQDLLPCPLCGSTNLSANLWSLDHCEVDAVECNECYCGAPLTAWQNRASPAATIHATGHLTDCEYG